jgi:hypothetical protein
MIEIIKHGKFKKGTARCPKCGCEFSFDERDVDPAWRTDTGRYLNDASLPCPECGVAVENLEWDEEMSETDWVFENDDIVLPIWIAKDKWVSEDSGPLHIFGKKPKRLASEIWGGECGLIVASIPENWFPEITWEDEPVEAELTIKRK